MLSTNEVIEDYTVIRMLGKGGSAEVYLVHSAKFSRVFAAKVIKCQHKLAQEVKILLQLDHNNIVRVYDTINYKEFLVLILDYCPSGLEAYIKHNGPMSEADFRRISREIIIALDFVHSRKIAHCDIKPANILMDQYGHAKISDFGISIEADGKINRFAGSLPYLAPEIIFHTNFDPFLADMWALGVTFYYMFTGKLPWSHTVSAMQQEIMLGAPRISRKIPTEYWFVIKQLMHEVPKCRLTTQDLLKNPLFAPAETQTQPLISVHKTVKIQKPCLQSVKSCGPSVQSLHRSQLQFMRPLNRPHIFQSARPIRKSGSSELPLVQMC